MKKAPNDTKKVSLKLTFLFIVGIHRNAISKINSIIAVLIAKSTPGTLDLTREKYMIEKKIEGKEKILSKKKKS